MWYVFVVREHFCVEFVTTRWGCICSDGLLLWRVNVEKGAVLTVKVGLSTAVLLYLWQFRSQWMAVELCLGRRFR